MDKTGKKKSEGRSIYQINYSLQIILAALIYIHNVTTAMPCLSKEKLCGINDISVLKQPNTSILQGSIYRDFTLSSFHHIFSVVVKTKTGDAAFSKGALPVH